MVQVWFSCWFSPVYKLFFWLTAIMTKWDWVQSSIYYYLFPKPLIIFLRHCCYSYNSILNSKYKKYVFNLFPKGNGGPVHVNLCLLVSIKPLRVLRFLQHPPSQQISSFSLLQDNYVWVWGGTLCPLEHFHFPFIVGGRLTQMANVLPLSISPSAQPSDGYVFFISQKFIIGLRVWLTCAVRI